MARVRAWCGAAALAVGLGIALLCGASVASADSGVESETGSGAVSGVARGSDDAGPSTPTQGVSRGKSGLAADEDDADDADVRVEPAEPRRIQVAAARTSSDPGEAVVDALLGAARAFLPEPRIPDGSRVTLGRSTLEIPCGCEGTTVDATWYFPNQDTEPDGLIYLQHGFFRDNRAMSALAVDLSERTNSVVVTPTLSSNFLTPSGCWINGEPMQQAVATLFEGDRRALTASAFAAGYTTTLPRRYVLSGHSAGGGLAVAAAAANGDDENLAGVVMFDGVTTRERMSAALSVLPPRVQVLQIAAPPSPWNADGAATAALIDARPNQFVGVRLVNGTHIDAEGASSDALARLLVGAPVPANVAAVPVIAGQWISTLLAGGRVTGAPAHPVPGAIAVPLQYGPPGPSRQPSRSFVPQQ
jgi:dienelactone hydrolase